jgi:dihydroorotase
VYDSLLKSARVVDPAQGIDGVFDIAIKDGLIACLANVISAKEARATYPLDGKIVTPGLIDAHCHPALNFTDHAVLPDRAGVDSGVLLVNDAGSAGAANFHTLREMYGKRVRTEMTYFLNVASSGQIHPPEIQAIHDIDIKLLKATVEQNSDVIKGLKLRLFDPLVTLNVQSDVAQLALAAAEELHLPLMIHVGAFRARSENDPLDSFSRSVIKRLRKGDIVSHYMTWRPGGMVLPNGEIFPELKEAQERGVLLDCSHGKNNFSFKVAEVLIANALQPDIISTDLSSMGVPHVQSLLVTMSKFIDLGMSLGEVVAATTCTPARALGMEHAWGSLKTGRPANISVLEDVAGHFSFFDGAAGNVRQATHLLEPRMVVRNGEFLPCRSFYHLPNEA